MRNEVHFKTYALSCKKEKRDMKQAVKCCVKSFLCVFKHFVHVLQFKHFVHVLAAVLFKGADCTLGPKSYKKKSFF